MASRLLPATAAPFDPAAPAWVLADRTSRYHVRLRGASVLLDCFAADDESAPPEGEPPPDTAMITAGPEGRPVSWRVATWHQPDAGTLRLALAGTEFPLSAEIVLAIDRATGVLSRNTMLRHHGTGSDVTIATTLAFCCAVHEPVERVVYLAGAWAHEAQVRRGPGDVMLDLETRTGKTGFE
ncbi:MAG TPA: glycoside hydrolase family 36 N-terminal domain-containing protein, partial [Acetobacteraceae bacterium]|nr:glycoside hydrolase family 36 N-terminal domain-containing protein [Acetobacteraceae bacterium]